MSCTRSGPDETPWQPLSPIARSARKLFDGEVLGCAGGYKTTEDEVSSSFPHLGAAVSRGQGLWLVQWSCRQLGERVFSLRQGQQEARDDGG
jgi:hypothetical protein